MQEAITMMIELSVQMLNAYFLFGHGSFELCSVLVAYVASPASKNRTGAIAL